MSERLDVRGALPSLNTPDVDQVEQGTSRGEYAQTWLDALRAMDPDKPVPAFEAADPVKSLGEPVGSTPRPFDMKAMRKWINDPGEERKALIVCMASRDDAWFQKMREALEKYGYLSRSASDEDVITAYALASRASAAGRKAKYSSILFVDLAGGNPHCVMFARAWATAFSGSLLVAYWDPQQAPPDRPK